MCPNKIHLLFVSFQARITRILWKIWISFILFSEVCVIRA
ncbi:hypothetical protein HMPREF9445_02919 [Bacteroides clarus YIT 12056]|uniref:Uncharacterized protein n=1 Tax=Bacteroides clarus YIT 12056 TaxID=762984 RepID=A0ABP2KP55_9BACE|nr:hypothetical protein HMPREF9445_02919 [Bacteroides clarus YIT 12056]